MPHDEVLPAPPASDRKRRSTQSQESGSRGKRARTIPAGLAPPANSEADAKPPISQLAANDGVDRPQSRSGGVKDERRTSGGNVIDLTQGDVKREHSPIRLPAAHLGGVIDLTLEGD